MLASLVVLVLGFTAMGLLLGLAQSFDMGPEVTRAIDERDPDVQQVLFEDCIDKAKSDGELTDEEYYRCAYDIYD